MAPLRHPEQRRPPPIRNPRSRRRPLRPRRREADMRNVLLVTALLVVAPYGWAQQAQPAAPSHDAPSPADLEPGVNTSAPAPADTPAPAAISAPKSAVA